MTKKELEEQISHYKNVIDSCMMTYADNISQEISSSHARHASEMKKKMAKLQDMLDILEKENE